jgi:small subunit ribosomal protein S20
MVMPETAARVLCKFMRGIIAARFCDTAAAGARIREMGLPGVSNPFIIPSFIEICFATGKCCERNRPRLGIFMANTAQARKRARQAVKQNAHNSSQRSALRTAIKAVRKAIEGGDKSAATQVFQSSISTIDRIADKKIIHKNKAARHKSRLAAALKALA